MEIVVRAFI